MRHLKKYGRVIAASLVFLAVGGAAPALASPLRTAEMPRETISAPESVHQQTIRWQGEVEGIPGDRVTQELIMSDGERVTITVDWESNQIEIDRSFSGKTVASIHEIQAVAAQAQGSDLGYMPQRSPEDINWGSLCQWMAGLTGIGHAAIWSMVNPWIGIPYGVFWLWVGMQCK